MFKNILILFFILFLVSCTDTKNGKTIAKCDYKIELIEGATINIDVDLDAVKGYLSYNNILDSFEYIKLQTTEESVIGAIDKVFIEDGLVIIGDYYKTKSIYIFDINGAFINKICNLGKGPARYRRIADFDIDRDLNFIEILAADDRKIMKFDFEGRFIGEKRLDFPSSCFAKTALGYSFFLNNKFDKKIKDSYNLYFTNKDLQVVKKNFPFNIKCNLFRTSRSYHYVNFNEEVLFSPVYNNNIYKLGENVLSCKYKINFGQYSIDSDYIYNKKNKEINALFKENKIADLRYFAETKETLYMMINWGGKRVYCFYNKKTKTLTSGFLLKNEIDLCLTFSRIFPGSDRSIISYVEPTFYNSCKKSLGTKFYDNKLTVEDYDNPILVIAYEKN